MSKIAWFWGTQTKNTKIIAEPIHQHLGSESIVTLYGMADANWDDFAAFDCLIVGCPTGNTGERQSDWDAVSDALDESDALPEIDLSGNRVADFGASDQIDDADNFQDVMGLLAGRSTALGGETLGCWWLDGDDFAASKAMRAGEYVGLAMDKDNQAELTTERIAAWTAPLETALGLSTWLT
ncbi:MAG: flavodoxin FldA [Leptolyngbya sp. SIOISBB]|nr:flavodoxin FldA [Leptolyngbya sp. SIOISBB]